MHVICPEVEQAARISFVKPKDALAVQALDALTVGLVDRCSIGLIQTDATCSLVERLLVSLSLQTRRCQLIRQFH